MTPRRRQGDSDRLYRRNGRWWGDFRDFKSVGGSQEPLVPPGDRWATEDKRQAERLCRIRANYYRGRIKGWAEASDPELLDYMIRHLEAKTINIASETLQREKRSFARHAEFFGEHCLLSEITPHRLTDYVAHRLKQPGKRGKTTSRSTVRVELEHLSNMFVRAMTEGAALVNPVRLMLDRPKRMRSTATWLEVGEAARLIRVAFERREVSTCRMLHHFPVMLATYLLTGGRARGVAGLLVDDIDYQSDVVHFRANEYRGLKTPQSTRTVPLWPQLREYLEMYDAEGPLLFPNADGQVLQNVDTALRGCLKAAKIDRVVTLKSFRHTYAATRMQTLDHGQPVSAYTVARELGHTNASLIESTYGHLQRRRQRLEVVEYLEASVTPIRPRQQARRYA